MQMAFQVWSGMLSDKFLLYEFPSGHQVDGVPLALRTGADVASSRTNRLATFDDFQTKNTMRNLECKRICLWIVI